MDDLQPSRRKRASAESKYKWRQQKGDVVAPTISLSQVPAPPPGRKSKKTRADAADVLLESLVDPYSPGLSPIPDEPLEIAQPAPEATKQDNNNRAADDGDRPLTERESLLIWAAAKAAYSLSASQAMAVNLSEQRTQLAEHRSQVMAAAVSERHAQATVSMLAAPSVQSSTVTSASVSTGTTTLTVTVVQVAGPRPQGLPELASLDVSPGTTIRAVREHLQGQIQDILDRYWAAAAPHINPRPIATVLAIYDADFSGAQSHMLLDSATRYSDGLGVSLAVRSLALPSFAQPVLPEQRPAPAIALPLSASPLGPASPVVAPVLAAPDAAGPAAAPAAAIALPTLAAPRPLPMFTPSGKPPLAPTPPSAFPPIKIWPRAPIRAS
jgi:hypothetical protein